MNLKVLLFIPLCFALSIVSKAQSISTQDSLALLAFVDATNGNDVGGWNNLLAPAQQWTGANPTTQWFGLSTSIIASERRATSIELAGVGMQSAFPNSIFNDSQLEELVVLDLGHNQLTSNLDNNIFDHLPKLKELRINDNLLEGELPSPANSSYDLEYLQDLDLSNNNFVGDLRLDWLIGAQIAASISSGNSTPIQVLNCNGNSFEEVSLSASAARFDSLVNVSVEDNFFHFDDLYTIASGLKMVQTFGEHYAPQNAPSITGGLDTLAFSYAPQAEAGIGGVRRRPEGNIIFNSGIGEPTSAGIYNSTNWSRNQGLTTEILGTVNFSGILPILSNLGLHTATLGSVVLAPSNNRQAVQLANIDVSHHDWLYKACVTNDSFPLLEICMLPKKLIVGACYDDFGKEIACQEIIIQFEDGTTESEKDALRKEMGITLLDSCLCGAIERWGISDTTNMIDVEENGKGTKKTAHQSQTRPNMLGSDPNYELLAIAPISTGDNNPSAPSGTTHPKPTLIAIIDSGVDYDHPSLDNRVWINPDDAQNGMDEDGNCAEDDSWGYNFLEHTAVPYDDHGHGSAIAGVVTGKSIPNELPSTGSYDSLAILPIKFTNRDRKGTLFNAACAVRYAAAYQNPAEDQKVRVINASWGYYGEPSAILEETIRYAGESCGMLFICSAGNDAVDIDTAAHYPSNYDLENIITVAATNPIFTNKLASYSNFGVNNADLATGGNYTTTGTFPLGLGGLEVVDGTSFATAQISRAAGLLFHAYPDASYRAVKRALLQGVDRLNSVDSSKLVSKGKLNYSNSLSILAADTHRQNCMPEISLNIQLEGALDTVSGTMRDDLYANGYLPNTQPFNMLPWFYDGGEVLTASFGANTPVDWLLLSICSGEVCVYKAAILLKDGTVIDADGTGLDMPSLPTNSCRLQIIPRNHLASISTQEITLSHPSSTIDLSGILTNIKTIGGWEALPAGDSNGDGQVNPVDKNGYWRVEFGQNGYLQADYNLDGTVDNTDYQFWLNNQSIESDCRDCRSSTN